MLTKISSYMLHFYIEMFFKKQRIFDRSVIQLLCHLISIDHLFTHN